MDKKKCPVCDKVFPVKGKIKNGRQLYCHKSSIHFKIKKYCSRKCYLERSRSGYWRGKKSSNWSGGKIIRDGYIYLYKPDHPYSGKQGYVAEHRIVMEKIIKRYLKKKEVIHHKNRDRKDNRRSNLELYLNAGQHIKLAHPEVTETQKVAFKGRHFSPRTEFKKGNKPWNKE